MPSKQAVSCFWLESGQPPMSLRQSRQFRLHYWMSAARCLPILDPLSSWDDWVPPAAVRPRARPQGCVGRGSVCSRLGPSLSCISCFSSREPSPGPASRGRPARCRRPCTAPTQRDRGPREQPQARGRTTSSDLGWEASLSLWLWSHQLISKAENTQPEPLPGVRGRAGSLHALVVPWLRPQPPGRRQGHCQGHRRAG